MDAPEKFYLLPNGFISYFMNTGEDIEYVRKDTFIEEACEFIAGNMKCSIYTTQTKAKFIKEFRNYMKGE